MLELSAGFKDNAQKLASTVSIPSALLPARSRFCDQLPQRAAAFERFRTEFNVDQNRRESLIGINALAHKLAGVAETIGFPEAGRLAAVLEQSTSFLSPDAMSLNQFGWWQRWTWRI